MALNDRAYPRRTAFLRTTTILSTPASTITLPVAATAPGGYTPPPTGEIEVFAPSGNSDPVFVAVEGAATTASIRIDPGQRQRLRAPGPTISAISGSGTMTLDVTTFHI